MADTGVSSPLEEFVEKLIEEKNFPDLAPEVYEQVKKDLVQKLQETINARAIASLPQDKLEELNEMLDKGTSDEEVQKFMEANVPNAESFLTTVLMEFRKSYLGQA